MASSRRNVLSLLVSVISSGTSLSAAGLAWADQPPARMAEEKSGNADALQGKWKHPDEALVIEIVKSGAGYEAKIVESSVAAAPVGKLILRGVSFDAGKGEWRGEVFAIKRGEFVPMTAKLSGTRQLEMTAGKGILSKKLTWTRP